VEFNLLVYLLKFQMSVHYFGQQVEAVHFLIQILQLLNIFHHQQIFQPAIMVLY
jgi:hypothetical protein